MTSARAIATRCCSPADSWSGLWRSLPVRSTSAMTSRIRSASSPLVGSSPAIVNGSATFSAASRSGIRLNDWKTKPVRSRRSRVASSSDSWLTTWPSRTTSPDRRPVEPAEDLEEGRLARARRAHQGDELAGLDRERDAAQCLDALRTEWVGLGQLACLEDGGHGRQCSGGCEHPGPRRSSGAAGRLRGACRDDHVSLRRRIR